MSKSPIFKLCLLLVATVLVACSTAAPLDEAVGMQQGDRIKVAGSDITVEYLNLSKDISESGESYYAGFEITVDGATKTMSVDMGDVATIGDYFLKLNAVNDPDIEITISAESPD